MVNSGSYTIQSVSLQKGARLATNNPNAPVELVDSSGADNETWVAKSYTDGTFTIHNKQWAENAYAGVASASSGQQVKAVSVDEATRWKKSGSQIVISGFAWQATSDGKIILKPVDTADSNQSFNINSA
ncbi:hypothetical protein AGABI1DRAFT_134006 [Agaricus bisporus var. burnettii JB137-S8]|uniref:Ricin B lectin domain-containing protein n=2 Tax=Agaricus bisporus var. burnettii TaxID=192524 RepID=A0A8H7C484_AGABI|nr:uncharacterized protein AGABI1DRAFT_134006 [Agaricus bisporus var. burnettii JB137-S8]EKM73832.1 hypothetical protein AGABI1DRAFT_134006 [Agaricus bisporus var. burnettii JB137-S8]KAF7761878.1 hypothetical protein Agabi119p4_9870 [Agaricus bisporus var. burnettii]KAF7761884.1 hypothetical protein Agabi119p4_9876 [Agaricus bisporus var. burnettii]